MNELTGTELWVAGFLLALVFAGPVFALVPLIFNKQFQRTDGGKVVFATALTGVTAFYIAWNSGFTKQSDAVMSFFHQFVGPGISLLFLIGLGFGARAIGRMGLDGAQVWVRIASFWILLVCIPLGFAPIADALDGERAIDSVSQYFAEFVWRIFDMVTFGFLSSFSYAGYDQIVVYTAANSWSVVLFNLVMGLFVFSSVLQIIRPGWSYQAFTRTS
ncbi:MAG: hypothetical protein AAFQ24_12410 [Pseudomonadota bacterium]